MSLVVQTGTSVIAPGLSVTVCGAVPGSRLIELRDDAARALRYRLALEEIASYQEHGRHSAITPSVLARRAQQALDDESLRIEARRAM